MFIAFLETTLKKNQIAYLVSQYPKVSHTFIRREILALENQGFDVVRLSVRGWDNELSDPVDQQERTRTRYLLKNGTGALLKAGWSVLMKRPAQFWNALCLAFRLSCNADRSLPFHLIYLLEACQALLWLEQTEVKHVHAHFGTNGAEVALLLRALGGPSFSFTVHGPEEFDKPTFIKLKEKVEGSAFVVAISSYCRSQIFRWLDYTQWHKVKEVHCGLEDSFHEAADSPVPDNHRLVCVGRLCEQKGQLILLEAVARLVQQGIPVELVLAGDGEMRSEVEAQIRALNIAKQVRITGWISSDQVRTEILNARGMVLPSFGEGLPVVIMEAMALRRPVLSTYIAAIPELVIPGENGFLFPAGDVDALAQAMAECLSMPLGQLQDMGEKARVRVLARHHVETEAEKLGKLFEAHMGQP